MLCKELLMIIEQGERDYCENRKIYPISSKINIWALIFSLVFFVPSYNFIIDLGLFLF